MVPTNRLETLIACLSWNENPARQNEAVAVLVAAGDRLDLSLILQTGDKSRWQNEARILLMLGYPRFIEVIPSMLEWLQDLSWPGSEEIVEALAGMPKDELAGHIAKAVEHALVKKDTEWLVGLRHLAREASLAPEDVVDSRTRAALLDEQIGRGFDAERLDSLRRNFDMDFDRALAGAHLARLPAWFERRPSDDPFETTIQCWVTVNGARVMVLEEIEATDTLDFDYFTKRTGIDYEIEMLHMKVRNVDRHVPFIVECYRRWLLDREGEESVYAFIQKYVIAGG